jgi:ABC-type multidrug transport system fused ATPase/permease subunit
MFNPFKDLIKIDQLPKDRDLSDLPNGLWMFIWFFVRQAKWPFFFMALIQLFSSGLEAMGPYFIKVLVDSFQTVENKQDIWSAFGWALPAFVVLFLVIQPVTARIATAFMAETRMPFMNMIRRQLSLYMYKHDYAFFQNEFAGRLSSKVLETPYALIQIVFDTIMGFGFVFMSFVVSLVLFAMVDISFLMATLAWFSSYILMCLFFVPKIIRSSTKMYDDLSIVRGKYVDSLNNIMGVLFFNRKKHEDKLLTDSLQTSSQSGVVIWHTMNKMYMWLELLSTVFIGGVFYLCVVEWQQGELTLGEVAMVLPMMLRLMQMSWWVSDMLVGMFENIGQVQEGMQAILSGKILKDDEYKIHLKIDKDRSIKMKDVLFNYDTTSVFKDMNLEIPANQKIGLVGQSGAGKTTLTQLLFRMFDAQSGKILIGEQNIYDCSRSSLRDQIAIIPQHTDMFHRTLMDNIRYGRLDATDAEVMEAAKKAHAHDFISKLPDGYQTMVGERGVKLSGGQRQRIAIARAILKDAPILILDEATSALDSESEKAIQDSLKTLMEGKTVIAIAHRLSTIAHLDRIIVMDDGQIVEDGTHDELIKNDRHYAMLWSMQSGGFLKE